MDKKAPLRKGGLREMSIRSVNKQMNTPLNFTALTLRVQKMSPFLGAVRKLFSK